MNLPRNVAVRRAATALVLLTPFMRLPAQVPVNDDCTSAIPIVGGINGIFNLAGATSDVLATCDNGPNPSVWFHYTAPLTGMTLFSLCPADGGFANFDSTLAIFDACGGVELCCNDDACLLQSKCCIQVTAGTTYFVKVASFDGSTGTFDLAVGEGSCGCPPIPPGPCVNPPPFMTSWLPFDAVAFGSTLDCAGGAAATVVGATLQAGCVMGALDFDGVDDYVQKPHQPNMNPTNTSWWNMNAGSLTVEAWIAADAVDGVRAIVDKRTQVGAVVRGYHFFLFNGQLGVQLANGVLSAGTTFSNYLSTGLVPADGCCHHVAVTVKRWFFGSVGVFYIDGVAAGTFNPGNRMGSLANTSPFRVGSRSASLSGFFDGRIADVAFYRRALTAAQILSLFNAGAAGKCMGVSVLVAPFTASHASQPTVVADALVTNMEAYGQTVQWNVLDMGNGAGFGPLWNGGPAASPDSGTLVMAPGETVRLPIHLLRPPGFLSFAPFGFWALVCTDAAGVQTISTGAVLDSAEAYTLTTPAPSAVAAGEVFSITSPTWSGAPILLDAYTGASFAPDDGVIGFEGRGIDYSGAAAGVPYSPSPVANGVQILTTLHDDDPAGDYALVVGGGGGVFPYLGSVLLHGPAASHRPRLEIVRASDFNPALVPPASAGTVEIRIEGGAPDLLYVLLATTDGTNFPHGPYGGVTFDLANLAPLLAYGPPFFGVLDADGAAGFVMPDLALGLEFFGVAYVLDPAAPNGYVHSAPTRFTF